MPRSRAFVSGRHGPQRPRSPRPAAADPGAPVAPARVTLPSGHRTDARPPPLPASALYVLPPPSGPVTPRRPAAGDPDRPATPRPAGPPPAPRPGELTESEASEAAALVRQRQALNELRAATAAPRWPLRRRVLVAGLVCAALAPLVLTAVT